MTSFPAFEHLRSQKIASLNLEVEEYRHRITGAQHIHISADNSENVFLVALRTVPEDSRGVAHILEHTALCGSEKYPVRDPFFMMIRRSLNTFMNAFTSSDWTAYPFASQNRKDFYNLLDVYLDAVFFPNLDPLDFAQEGHRLEFAELDNPASKLEFKGVVFNEMKGAMSSATSILWHTLSKYLYPTTTYHYNSGGDPEQIPDLSYDDLVQFHRSHYHPSNAIFMTYGDIDAAEHQRIFETRALNRFVALDHQISVPLERRYQSPQRLTEAYATPENEDTSAKTHVVVGWLLGESIDLKSAMQAHLLASVLLENSASPLQQTLETSNLGRAPSPLCGLDDSQREMCFVCGLEGCETDATEAVETQILDVLEQVVAQGVSVEHMEACLHQLELQQREITGDSYPFGLQLILSSLNSATHRGDPVALLDLDPVINELREQIKQPDFIRNLCRELLLDNPHRITLTLTPDPELANKQQDNENQRLEQIRTALGQEQIDDLIVQAKALQDRQSQADDPGILPKVGLEDVPAELDSPEPAHVISTPGLITSYAAGTNGLVYQEIIAQLPALNDDELALIPLLSYVWTELAVGGKSYLQTQQWQSAVSGGIGCSVRVQPMPEDQFDTRGLVLLHGKALKRNQSALSELMQCTFEQTRFHESDRVRELVAQIRARSENSITGNGHSLAMGAAASRCSPAAAMAFANSGLEGIRRMKSLDDSLSESDKLDELLSRLAALHTKVTSTNRQLLLVGEAQELENYRESMMGMVGPGVSAGTANAFQLPDSLSNPAPDGLIRDAWIANSQVNFCAKAYATVPTAHADAPALTVLGGYLRNSFLHTAIREQGGAYGGGAGQDNYNGAFRFFSYRDPRMAETLDDFDRAIDWMLNSAQEPRLLEEAILGVVAGLDKPGSPAGEARAAFHGELFGRNNQIRKSFRKRVMQVGIDDLRRVTQQYLNPQNAHTAVVTGTQGQSSAETLGLSINKV